VISRPTTEQVILDCCAELLDGVLPAITDEVTASRLGMIEAVLRSAAVRSGHEIAWMRAETMAMDAFVRKVAEREPDLLNETDVLEATEAGGLHLDDVVGRYCRAGDAFSRATEAARRSGNRPLLAEAAEILEQRVAHERLVRGVWSSAAGR
jgi:hypothetical protein